MGISIPPEVWRPIAERIAEEHGIAVAALRFESQRMRYFIPRAKFFRELRALPAGYSLPAIAEICAIHHATVHAALKSVSIDKPYAKFCTPARIRRTASSLVGRRFGLLLVIKQTAQPAGYKNDKVRWWLCTCDCGGQRITPTTFLTMERATTCGAKHHRKKHFIADGAAALVRAHARSEAARTR